MGVLTTTEGQANLPRYFGHVFQSLQNMAVGQLDIGLPDGRVFRVRTPGPGPEARFDVINPALFSRILREGEIGFPEAFMGGWWTTPDLQALLDVILLNNDQIGTAMPGMGVVRLYERARHWLRSNSRAQARRNISHHYDLGNDFYGMWLDGSMTYSSALFQDQNEPLETAQARKYASICDMIGAGPDGHILEIGCGWGGFAEHAVLERGARVTGLTLSREQHDFARKRAFEAGIAERVDIVLRDYRDENGTYDGIASIEMFEAVGEKYWPQYFSNLNQRLKPGARAGLQIITVSDHLFANYRKGVDFIQKYIFPGGMLPSVSALGDQIRMAGLAETDMIRFGQSYSETLRRWRRDFNAAWDGIEPLGFDARFAKMWNFYLASCAACFMAETTDVIQIGLRHET